LPTPAIPGDDQQQTHNGQSNRYTLKPSRMTTPNGRRQKENDERIKQYYPPADHHQAGTFFPRFFVAGHCLASSTRCQFSESAVAVSALSHSNADQRQTQHSFNRHPPQPKI
jgi:hypothetical protein